MIFIYLFFGLVYTCLVHRPRTVRDFAACVILSPIGPVMLICGIAMGIVAGIATYIVEAGWWQRIKNTKFWDREL